MDNSLIINEITARQLALTVKRPPHALLLNGPKGSGLHAIADRLAFRTGYLAFEAQPDEKGTITIAQIRELYVRTRGKSSNKRVVIIDDAEAMGHDAQNALLKLLEEPPQNCMFILTTHNIESLLPTIISRVQVIEVNKISTDQSKKILLSFGIADKALVQQLLFIAGGLPSELIRLSQNEEYRNNMIDNAQKAKIFIAGSRYEQIALISKLASKREESMAVLEIALRMLRVQLGKSGDMSKVLDKIEAYTNALERLARNGHVRTQLLRTVR